MILRRHCIANDWPKGTWLFVSSISVVIDCFFLILERNLVRAFKFLPDSGISVGFSRRVFLDLSNDGIWIRPFFLF